MSPPSATAPALPFVLINTAITADGKIAFDDGSFVPFGSRRDQEHLLHLRSRADAVMTGARTVNASPVTLGSGGAKYQKQRRRAGRSAEPIRIVVSGTGSINPKAELFRHTFSPIIVLTTGRMPVSRRNQLRNLGAIVEVCGARSINFTTALRSLRRKWGIATLLCEGGGGLNESLIRAGLVHEINLTVCPFIFGGGRAPTLADGLGVPTLAKASGFRLRSMKPVGSELFLVYRKE